MRERLPNKKTLLAGAGGLLLVTMFAVLYMVFWSPPSKTDFAQAQTQTEVIKKTYESISEASTKYVDQIKKSPDDTSAIAKTYENALTDHAQKLADLGSQKALRDTEVRSAYEAFETKDKKFVAYSRGYVALQKSFAVCIGLFQVTRETDGTPKAMATAHKKISEKCTPILKELQGSSVSVLSRYGSMFMKTMTERQKAFDDVANGSMSETDGGDKISDIAARFSKDSDIINDLSKARDDASVIKEFEALQALLKKKAENN
jgi:hypothetical protein